KRRQAGLERVGPTLGLAGPLEFAITPGEVGHGHELRPGARQAVRLFITIAEVELGPERARQKARDLLELLARAIVLSGLHLRDRRVEEGVRSGNGLRIRSLSARPGR